METTPTAIVGSGSYLPADRLTNSAIEDRLQLARGTVEPLLGVSERRVAPAEHAVSDLAAPACQAALEDAGLRPSEVGLLILATSTPDHPVPATAPAVAHRLGLTCPAFDLANACAGWMYGLEVANRWLQGGGRGPVVVCGANALSRRVNWDDWGSAALFGDGAGATVLALGPGKGHLKSSILHADGAGASRIQVPAGGSRHPISIDLVQRNQHLLVVQRAAGMLEESLAMMTAGCREALLHAGWRPSDVDHFLPHQANARLVSAAATGLGIPAGRVHGHLDRLGNMSAASLPVLLDEAARAGRFQAGDRILLGVVAAGMASGAACISWG